MRILMIQFSPSGSTLKVSSMLKQVLEARGGTVQVLDMTGHEAVFLHRDPASFLACAKPHDVMLIGGPVYAHHLQYHVQTVLRALPVPDAEWGRYAIPYVCYGGISSGVALKEAASLLKKSGRLVPCGLKVSAPHSMTRAFMPQEFNGDKLQTGCILPELEELADRVTALENGIVRDASPALAYNGLMTSIKAKILFNEKLWHEKRYPKIKIDEALCTNCGTCAGSCPVLHLKQTDGGIRENADPSCIHCFNCVVVCPANAVRLIGNNEKGKAFMAKMIVKSTVHKEIPETAIYPPLKKGL